MDIAPSKTWQWVKRLLEKIRLRAWLSSRRALSIIKREKAKICNKSVKQSQKTCGCNFWNLEMTKIKIDCVINLVRFVGPEKLRLRHPHHQKDPVTCWIFKITFRFSKLPGAGSRQKVLQPPRCAYYPMPTSKTSEVARKNKSK